MKKHILPVTEAQLAAIIQNIVAAYRASGETSEDHRGIADWAAALISELRRQNCAMAKTDYWIHQARSSAEVQALEVSFYRPKSDLATILYSLSMARLELRKDEIARARFFEDPALISYSLRRESTT
jgi:hypothetical protein